MKAQKTILELVEMISDFSESVEFIKGTVAADLTAANHKDTFEAYSWKLHEMLVISMETSIDRLREVFQLLVDELEINEETKAFLREFRMQLEDIEERGGRAN